MKKFVCYITVLSLIICTVVFGGCAKVKKIGSNTPTYNYGIVPENTATVIDSEEETNKIFEKYADKFGSEHIYADIFSPYTYLLVGQEKVVSVFYYNNYEEITEINISEITQLENVIDEQGYSSLKVKDGNDNLILFSLSIETAEEVVSLIR